MSIEDDILSRLENPETIDDQEARRLMEQVETHYMASLEADNENIKEYEREVAERRLEDYRKAVNYNKESAQYDF